MINGIIHLKKKILTDDIFFACFVSVLYLATEKGLDENLHIKAVESIPRHETISAEKTLNLPVASSLGKNDNNIAQIIAPFVNCCESKCKGILTGVVAMSVC